MESFVRRLKYYGLGFGIGLIAVFLIFGNRACNWGPKQRIKTSILERVVVINELNDSIKNSLKLSDSEVMDLIEKMDIDFSESKKDNPLKVYKFTSDELDFHVTLPENSYLAEIVFSPETSSSISNSNNGFGRILHFPKEKDLMYIPEDSPSFNILKEINCSDANDLFNIIMKQGQIDFNRSKLNDPWDLDQVIFCRDVNNKNVSISSYWYKEKIEVSSIQLSDNE